MGDGVWAERWIASATAALLAAPLPLRSELGARLGAILFACARDEEGDLALADARRDAARSQDPSAIARVELALAAAAQIRDDDARALTHVSAAVEPLRPMPPAIAARAWLVDVRVARAQGRSFPPIMFDPAALDASTESTEDRRELAAELALERAAVARDTRDWSTASEHLAHARTIVEALQSPRFTALYELEAGLYAADAGELEQGRARVLVAVELFESAGLKRDEARAIIRFAELLSANAPRTGDRSAAVWLGRAQTVLGQAATWRDRLSIRTGFRNFGRRVIDRVMTESAVTRIEAFERARGALLSALSLSAESSDRGLTELEMSAQGSAQGDLAAQVERVRLGGATAMSQTAQSIAEIDRAVHDLIELIGAALVERDRLRVLLNVLSEIDAVIDPDDLPRVVTRVAARVLEADHVVLAVQKNQQLVALGRHGDPPSGDDDAWRAHAMQATQRSTRPRSDPTQLAARGQENLCGPVLAVALRGREVSGALYADKLRRSGQFKDQDLAIANLLAEYIGLALGRLQAREKEGFALHQLAVTLDAIRDGVIACDERGVVTSVNAAAARMLRIEHDSLLGAQLERLPAVAPLYALVGSSARLDGAVVRLGHASFVVTSRPIGNEDDVGRGFVATLVELDRAQKIAQRLSATRARYNFNDIIGTSPSLHAAIAMAKRAANADASVLITGESGTGKEVIAQAIHAGGDRATEPFVGINVAALPRELLEAELFGYEKGAFTGARSEGNPGKFELAGEGTILLDEIGDMPLDMQAKLLRVLQERVVTRLGARQEIPMHARVIATTHRDLEQLVDEGKFRMDLLYRLRVLAVEMPPLRDRPEDIAPLAKHHLLRFAELQRKRVRELGPKVKDEMERYDWPGNVRELANVMEAEVSLIAPDADILERLATRLVGRFRTPGATSTGEWRALPPAPQDQPIIPLLEVEKTAFLHALDKCNQNVARAAEALGVSKVTFYAKLRSWGMHPKDRGEDDGPASARWSTRMRTADALAQTGATPIAVAGDDAEPSSRRGGPDTPKSRT